MWGLLALIAVVALMGGCAVAFGDRSMATVNADAKREVEINPPPAAASAAKEK